MDNSRQKSVESSGNLFGGIMVATQLIQGNPMDWSPTVENFPAQESACFEQK